MKTTRRTFLGTATAATAASLTAPVAAEASQAPTSNPIGTTKLAEADEDVRAQLMSRAKARRRWTKPAKAMAIPKEGYFKLEQDDTGQFSQRHRPTMASRLLLKIKPGREEAIRAYGKTIENAIAGDPRPLSPRSDFTTLRWVLFNIGGETYFMYQGIYRH